MAMRASLFWLGQCGRGLDEGGVAACMTIPQGSRACGTVECPMWLRWAVHAGRGRRQSGRRRLYASGRDAHENVHIWDEW